MTRIKKLCAACFPALFAILFVCLFPCIFMFSTNAGEARFQDIFPFLGLFLATAAAGFLVCCVIFRNISRAGFMTSLGMLVVINFSMLSSAVESLLPWFHSKFQLLTICLILLILMVLLLRKKPNLNALCIILAIAFGVLCLMNMIMAVPKLIAAASYHKPETELILSDGERFQGEKRNVYYLIFDEYGGDENLEIYFGYDNSAFYTALEEKGFSVSHSTKNTESCWTDTLIPNLLNLDYVASDEMPEKSRREFLNHPYLYQLFSENGYEINLINHRAYLKTEGTHELTENQVEDNISEYLLENSLFSKIPPIRDYISRKLFEYYRDNYAAPLNNAFAAMQNSSSYAMDEPTLTVSYIQSPHAPLIFRADGSQNETWKQWDWREEDLYPQQLQFVNQQILSAVTNIQERDPEAVIILLSDHGARVPLHMVEQFGGPRFDAEKETPVMQSALCCVYVPGQTLSIEGETGINAVRMTLDAAFGTALGKITPASGYVLDEIYNAKQ